MDRHNWNLPNANYYSHDYYNQVDGRYASLPEAGQTSSGPSWSHPTQGQPRPYLDLNFPPPGSVDWHSSNTDNYYQIHQEGSQYAFPPEANQPYQSIALEAGIQNDASPESSRAVEKRHRKRLAEVTEQFMAGLEKYAQGRRLTECAETIRFAHYVTTYGHLRDRGENLIKTLSPRDRDRVHQALAARQEIYDGPNNTTMDRFLGGLEAYARGASLQDCSETIKYAQYASADGQLRDRGKVLYRKLAEKEGEARVNEALAARREKAAERISGDIPHFLAALVPYSNGQDLEECGKKSGLKNKVERYQKVERYFTLEGGLTAKGKLLIENLSQEQQDYVSRMLEQRRQCMEQSTQAQEPPQQQPEMPASMPEMAVMNQAAMTGPMQTEAMWATAWQLTGQSVPVAWGLPSESAEHPIPSYSYGSEAVGANFQHQYGPMG
ncbi:MAG: hypothetical protein P8X74_13450 [Reinekea sp.]|jgi:hypothetical protein